MSRKWWFTLAATIVMATLYRNWLRAKLGQASANVRAFDPCANFFTALRSEQRLALSCGIQHYV
jgi:hypothetical protein